MPRISDLITINANRSYKAQKPQNGSTPAMFRLVDTTKSVAELSIINLGSGEETAGGKPRTRARLSIVQPVMNADRTLVLDTNRIDVTTRLSRNTTPGDFDAIKADLIALVKSSEFAGALIGEQQY